MRCLAIDPGAVTGWALYESRALTACGVCAPPGLQWGKIDRVLAEMPQKYPHDNVDPNRLLVLARNLGLVVGPLQLAGARIAYVKPAEWKDQEPKPVCHARLWKALTPAAQAIVAACGRGIQAKPLLDMLDAVALGQYALQERLW